MTADVYRRILENEMVPSVQNLYNRGEPFIFQEDNDPKHCARMIKEWHQDHGVHRMEWPPQSPDLNPIENLWAMLDRKAKKRRCSNERELFTLLQDTWNSIDPLELENLVLSMPKRCKAVIAAKGFCTKY